MDIVVGQEFAYYVVKAKEDKNTLKEVIESAGLEYSNGDGYYQLGKKKENISAQKRMVWWDGDDCLDDAEGIRGKFDLGSGKIKVNQDCCDGCLFIQSTSKNRQLPKGSSVMLRFSKEEAKTCRVASSSASAVTQKLPTDAAKKTTKKQKSPKKRALSEAVTEPVKIKKYRNQCHLPAATTHILSDKKELDVPESDSVSLSPSKWTFVESEDGPYFYSLNPQPANINSPAKIAAFDMDGTLIKTKSGRLHPINRGDWLWWHESVPKKLKGLHNDGYKIVIFTNQAGIAKGRTSYDTIAGKIKDMSRDLGLPIQAFIAGDTNQYRKPHARMWEEMVENHNEGAEIKKAFYVGDAAGRPKSKERSKRDFSCSDRSFAYNAKIMFYTPEEFFLKRAQEKFLWGSFDPEKFIHSCTDIDDDGDGKGGEGGDQGMIRPAMEQEIVVLVGPPASGKSRMAKSSLRSYTWCRLFTHARAGLYININSSFRTPCEAV